MKKGLIIGKGWIGNKLENYLNSTYDLTTTKRESNAENCIAVDFDSENILYINSSTFDFIVITIPFGKRNTLQELENRFNNLIRLIGNFKKQIILISSSGIYPDSNQIITESTYTDLELNEPYISIENKIKSQFPQTTILRLGGIMGDDRYLSKYLNANSPNLNEIVNHIHFVDVIQVLGDLIENNIQGKTYNVVAPEHPSKAEVLTSQGVNNVNLKKTKKGKTISSNILIKELKYKFIYPDPKLFNTID